jgi:eukaryotic-like serine/threonine-protein kinase
MTPERWQQIRDVLEKALELAPGERSAYLKRTCSSDSDLRQEVETLLASSDDVRSSFLQAPPAPRVALSPGTKLGDYEIKSMLGAGGMGEVYRARDARLGRDVAIKVLPALFSSDSDRLRRFEQEARAAAALNHPNILAIHQMGTHEGSPYLVSELLEGETLREQLKRGKLIVRKAIDFGVQVARGLSAAHEKGIVHRDLKPENLFVTKDGRVKILDFGLAKLTQPQSGSENSAPTAGGETEPGAIMGTVGYMSPEQVRGQSADHRTDIFSFGAILYEMLAGKRAFQKPTSPETMSAILNEDPASISQVTTSIPPALQRVVHRCLEKNPEQRFQSASDLAFALEALSEGSGFGSAATIPKPASTGNRILWLVVTTVIVIALTTAFFLWRRWAVNRASQGRHGEIVHRQLTSSAPGDPVLADAISRDGKYVAYVTANANKTRILEIASGDLRDLQTPDAPRPIGWFPDGSHMLVVRSGVPGIWKVSIWDGSYRKIIDAGSAWYVSISPDGSAIAYMNGLRELWVTGSDGDDPHRILAAGQGENLGGIAWSPRGSRLVYLRSQMQDGKDEAQIETCDLAGGHRAVVLREPTLWGPDGASPLAWLPHGRLVYSVKTSPASTTYDLLTVVVDPDTGARQDESSILTKWEKSQPEFFSISADGKRLIYLSRGESDALFLGDLRAADSKFKSRRLTTDEWNSYPGTWTHDSGAVFFSSLRGGRWVIAKVAPDSDTPEVLLSGAANYHHPVLSPDGTRLLFTESPDLSDSASKLMSMPVGGGARVALLPGNGGYQCGSSPSAGCVLGEFQGKELVFFALDPVKGKGEEIQRMSGNPGFVGWGLSPDGTKLAVVRGDDAAGWIRILSIADRKWTELPRPGTWQDPQFVTWAADGQHLFATGWSIAGQASQSILYIDPQGKLRALNQVKDNVGWLQRPKASPDGHYLAFTNRIFESNVTMLENF